MPTMKSRLAARTISQLKERPLPEHLKRPMDLRWSLEEMCAEVVRLQGIVDAWDSALDAMGVRRADEDF